MLTYVSRSVLMKMSCFQKDTNSIHSRNFEVINQLHNHILVGIIRVTFTNLNQEWKH